MWIIIKQQNNVVEAVFCQTSQAGFIYFLKRARRVWTVDIDIKQIDSLSDVTSVTQRGSLAAEV